MKKLVMAVIAVSVLVGCAENPRITAARAYVQVNSPMKFDKEQCDLKRQQVEYFIAKHSPTKIEISTPTTIQTYNQINTSLNVVTWGAAAHRLNTSTGCQIDINAVTWGGTDFIAIETIMKEVKSSS
ncbi:hypothetical protein V4836_08125 [Kluyvera ascorbata]|uniref:Lipoprotein n=1 Tax=Kluyvera ascorbata TaxID=51288 RepID=A0AB35X3H9_9ENTR